MKYIVLNLIMSFLIVCMINILLYNGNESEAVITAPDNPVENNPDDAIKEDNIVNDNKIILNFFIQHPCSIKSETTSIIIQKVFS